MNGTTAGPAAALPTLAPSSASAPAQENRMVRPRRPFGRPMPALSLVACLAVLALLRPEPARAAANQFCSGEYLAVGANWSLCWEIRANEGLAITHAFYTVPQSGFDRRRILRVDSL